MAEITESDRNNRIAVVRGWVRMGGIKVVRNENDITENDITAIYTNKTVADLLKDMGVPYQKVRRTRNSDDELLYRIAPADFSQVFGLDTLDEAALAKSKSSTKSQTLI